MAHSSGLAGRVRSILARGLDRAPVSPRRLLSTSVTALAVAFPLASVDIWGAAGGDVLQAFQKGDVEQRVRELEEKNRRLQAMLAGREQQAETAQSMAELWGQMVENSIRTQAAWMGAWTSSEDPGEPATAVGNLDEEE